MSSGKALCVIAAIVTFLGTFVFSMYAINPGTLYMASGKGIIDNIPDMFTNAATLGAALGLPAFLIYIIAGLLIFFLISCVLQALGVKSRAVAIIGSIMPLLLGTLIILGSFNILITNLDIWTAGILGTETPLFGFIPFKILDINMIGIGTYVLLAGGVLGLIGGIASHD